MLGEEQALDTPQVGHGAPQLPHTLGKGWNCKIAVDWPRQRCAAIADGWGRGGFGLCVPPVCFKLSGWRSGLHLEGGGGGRGEQCLRGSVCGVVWLLCPGQFKEQ